MPERAAAKIVAATVVEPARPGGHRRREIAEIEFLDARRAGQTFEFRARKPDANRAIEHADRGGRGAGAFDFGFHLERDAQTIGRREIRA